MKSLSKMLRGSCAIVTSGALVFSTLPTMAQDQPPPGAQLPPPAEAQQPQPAVPQLGRAELEKLLAPIALYPDDLVAQILTASTYPIEVVQASRWVSAHPNVHGNALQDAMQQEQWDPSVKGLTAVPQVLAMMNDKLDWTQQLGEAFLAQPNDITNAIQDLRAKAEANGNLRSSERIRVRRVAPQEPPPPVPIPVDVDPELLPPPPPPEYIVIEPVDPGVYYVPIYDPYVVYGPWLWPTYRPFYWYPPGYVVGAAVIGFSVGFFVGSALWCHYNWGWYGGGYGYAGWRGGGPVTINVVQFNQFNRTNFVAERNGFSNWQFEAAHRGTVQFQNAALRQQFGEPKNFQNFQRAALQGNLQGTQQGTPGQLHGNLQGNFQGSVQGGVQGKTLPGSQVPGGTGPLNTKLNTPPNVNTNANTKLNTNPNLNTNANTKLNTNPNLNTKLNPNPNINANTHLNTNANVNSNPNINRNLNINRGQNQNQNQNVNRNLNANQNPNLNRNFNGGGGGGGNVNRGSNVLRNAGPPQGFGGGGGGPKGALGAGGGGPKGGGGGGGGGGKGGKPDNGRH